MGEGRLHLSFRCPLGDKTAARATSNADRVVTTKTKVATGE